MKKFIKKVAVIATMLAIATLSWLGIAYIYEDIIYAVWSEAALCGVTMGIPFLAGITCKWLCELVCREPKIITVIKTAEKDVSEEEAA